MWFLFPRFGRIPSRTPLSLGGGYKCMKMEPFDFVLWRSFPSFKESSCQLENVVFLMKIKIGLMIGIGFQIGPKLTVKQRNKGKRSNSSFFKRPSVWGRVRLCDHLVLHLLRKAMTSRVFSPFGRGLANPCHRESLNGCSQMGA